MAIVDLGIVERPLLVFGGPYSNLQATEAMMTEARRVGFAPDSVICTGDVVAYAGNPAETTDALMSWGVATVMGNCEESFGDEADDCGCGFEEGTTCDVLSQQWYSVANAALTPAHRAWMRSCPERIEFTMAGKRIAVVHGGAASINEFVFEATDDRIKMRDLDALGVDGIIGGHAGVPFTQILGDRLWHNAGVIGMPANDGTPRVWYSILSPTHDGIDVALHALRYDYKAAASAMRTRGLPEGYASCLETGVWPNMDVMPTKERLKVGIAIEEGAVTWRTRGAEAAE